MVIKLAPNFNDDILVKINGNKYNNYMIEKNRVIIEKYPNVSKKLEIEIIKINEN
ncbi:MAG: hypothetical protein ACTSQO_13470 [Candidatus Helarchaeota archaeon]